MFKEIRILIYMLNIISTNSMIYIGVMIILIINFNNTKVSISGPKIRMMSSSRCFLILIWSVKSIFLSSIKFTFGIFHSIKFRINSLNSRFFLNNFCLKTSPLLYLRFIDIIQYDLLFNCLYNLFEHSLWFRIFTEIC